MPVRERLFALTLALAFVASGGTESEAFAEPPFGPIVNTSFFFVSGTSIEQPKDTCVNGDVLRILGQGVGNAKSVDISPRTFSYPNTKNRDKYGCEAPDCYQLFVQLSPKEPVGTRTVTLKSADGRTVTTKFDVTPHAGRCDYPKGAPPK
jgi:hypothetical protein